MQSVLSLLKTCAQNKDLIQGVRVHAYILRRGLLEENSYLGSSLVSMYAKCGALAKALEVFEDLPTRDLVSWSALITGYAQLGKGVEAFHCFEQMQHEGVSPNAVTYTCILKACSRIGASGKGKEIHEEIVSQGFMEKDTMLGNALVHMYAKCGLLAIAQSVHEELSVRDIFSWSALIAGYAEHGQGYEALSCSECMKHEGIFPNVITFAAILKACACIGAVGKGKQVHDEIVRQGLLEKDKMLGNALVDMYIKCDALTKAVQVFSELTECDVAPWSALISRYIQQGRSEDALKCFEWMQKNKLSSDITTFICSLKACGCMRAVEIGSRIHLVIVNQGLLGKDVILDTAIVDMYAKCGALVLAKQTFDELPARNVVTWSSLIGGYIQNGQVKEAKHCFECMQGEGLSLDVLNFIHILKACGNVGALGVGQKLHKEIVCQHLLGKNILLDTALVDMYAKCGLVNKAQQLLQELPVCDVVSWSALMTGCAQQGQGKEALEYFEQMQCEGLSPDLVSFICILKACGNVGATEKGQQFHKDIIRLGLLGEDSILGNVLLDMYAKCGELLEAEELLEQLATRDVVAWSTIIKGYAQQGLGERALECFERMLWEGFSPNAVTFTCMLNACSRSGLGVEGQLFIANIVAKLGIMPVLEHLTCMVDLYSRSGHFDRALGSTVGMSNFDDYVVLSAVLSACQMAGNVKLGRWVFECALHTS